VGIQGRRILLNDRRVLRALVEKCRFPESAYADVLITLDKYDKIGLDGVRTELAKSGYPSDCVEDYVSILERFQAAPDRLGYCKDLLSDSPAREVVEDLGRIIAGVATVSSGAYTPEFDLSLVRGMGYYTGAIFEITSTDFSGASIAGGGRYDRMIGQFTGKDVEACGFSIGFERIVRALMEKDATVGEAPARVAVLYSREVSPAAVALLQKKCLPTRQSGTTVAVLKASKNIRHQKARLAEEGYAEFIALESDQDVDALPEDLRS
jgi:histidyl-tRNA synthetase